MAAKDEHKACFDHIQSLSTDLETAKIILRRIDGQLLCQCNSTKPEWICLSCSVAKFLGTTNIAKPAPDLITF